VNQHEKKWLDLPWQQVRESVQVKLYEHEGELYVLAKSAGRQGKEKAIRRKRLARLLRKLRGMRRSLPKRDPLLLRIGATKKEAGRAFGFVTLRVPKADEEVHQAEQHDGHYLLRSNLTGEDPAVLWERYVQLTQIEAAFKTMKSELGLRPIYLAGERLCGDGKGPAVPLLGSLAGAQSGTVSASATALAGSVRDAFRCAVL
jgi:hypothetical protein